MNAHREARAIVACLIAAAALLAGPLSPAGAKPPPPKAVTADQLKDLLGKVEANGKLFAAGKTDEIDKSISGKMKAVTYDAKTFAIAKGLLTSHRRATTKNLYVLYAFIEPLTRAKPSLVRNELAWVKQVARLGRYRPFPKYPPHVLKTLKAPDTQKLSPEKMIQAIEKIRKIQQKKIARDMIVERFNRQAFGLNSLAYRLSAMAGDLSEDKRLVRDMARFESRGVYDWVVICKAIESEAKTMTAERAKVLYGAMRRLGRKLRWTSKSYANFGRGRINPEGNSEPNAERVYGGVVLLGAVNLLATPAKEPAIKVPTAKDVDAYQKRHSK